MRKMRKTPTDRSTYALLERLGEEVTISNSRLAEMIRQEEGVVIGITGVSQRIMRLVAHDMIDVRYEQDPPGRIGKRIIRLLDEPGQSEEHDEQDDHQDDLDQ